jgi:phosphatidylserine/phosphatidylglycerophosphate/cardiolipin synthase-like enzyme
MIRSTIAMLLVGAATPALAMELPPIYTTGDATVCFTTGNKSTVGGDCAALAVGEIEKAKSTLLVQAYNFTEPHIIAAIVAAHRRGVDVTIILDKISPGQKGEGADQVHDAGIPTFIDRKPKIAHNKVIVIDDATVITGSFNFSTNAECCNAENLLVIRRPELAVAYAENFARRRAVSVEYMKAIP